MEVKWQVRSATRKLESEKRSMRMSCAVMKGIQQMVGGECGFEVKIIIRDGERRDGKPSGVSVPGAWHRPKDICAQLNFLNWGMGVSPSNKWHAVSTSNKKERKMMN